MKGRNTSLFPTIFGITPISPIILLSNILIKEMLVIYVVTGILMVELIAKIVFKMTVMMMIRKLTRSMASFIYGAQLSGVPNKWKRKHWPYALCLVFVTLQADNSFAQFTITDSLRWDREWQSGSLGLSDADTLKATCRKCPLSLALKQLLPKEFTPYISEDVDKDIKINFISGRPWGMVLKDIATEHELEIELHKNGLRAIVDKSPSKRGRVSMVTLAPKKESFFETKTWELIPGDKLRASLERWAKKENWDVIYSLSDNLYIDVYAKFEGNLLEAIESLLAAYRQRGLLTRAKMTYSHANSTILLQLSEGNE